MTFAAAFLWALTLTCVGSAQAISVPIPTFKVPADAGPCDMSKLVLEHAEGMHMPFIIKGGLARDAPIRRWTDDEMRKKAGMAKVQVALTKSRVLSYRAQVSQASSNLYGKVTVRLADVLDVFSNTNASTVFGASTGFYYLSANGIPASLIEDAAQSSPAWLQWIGKLLIGNLRMGPADTYVTELHHDPAPGVMIMARGVKHWAMFAPEDTLDMKPMGVDSDQLKNWKHWSSLNQNLGSLDHLRNEELKKAWPKLWAGLPSSLNRFEGTTEPGDIIYVPAGFWHSVLTEGQSVAINLWFGPRPEDIGRINCPKSLKNSVEADDFEHQVKAAYPSLKILPDLELDEVLANQATLRAKFWQGNQTVLGCPLSSATAVAV